METATAQNSNVTDIATKSKQPPDKKKKKKKQSDVVLGDTDADGQEPISNFRRSPDAERIDVESKPAPRDDKTGFLESDKKQEYHYAHEAEELGRELIKRRHMHLGDTRIDFIFLKNTASASGREIWCKATLITGLNAWLSTKEDIDDRKNIAEPYFVIQIAYDIWKNLKGIQKEAMIDRELCRCLTNDEDRPVLTNYSVQEFESNIEEYGAWHKDAAMLIRAANQSEAPKLFDL